MTDRYYKVISFLSGFLTLLLAIFAFTLSFYSLQDLATTHGVWLPPLFPLIIEAAVVVFSLNALFRSLVGESAKWQWVLIIGSSLLAGVFNIMHAKDDVLSRSIAAMPSLFLILSFETFISQVKHMVERNSRIESLADLGRRLEQERSRVEGNIVRMRQQLRDRFGQERSDLNAQLERERSSLEVKIVQMRKQLRDRFGQERSDLNEELNDLRSQVEQLTVERDQLSSQIERLRSMQPVAQPPVLVTNGDLNGVNDSRHTDKDLAKASLIEYLRSNPNASLAQAGEQIGRGKSTVSGYLNELEEEGSIIRNGHGIEVRI